MKIIKNLLMCSAVLCGATLVTYVLLFHFGALIVFGAIGSTIYSLWSN